MHVSKSRDQLHLLDLTQMVFTSDILVPVDSFKLIIFKSEPSLDVNWSLPPNQLKHNN